MAIGKNIKRNKKCPGCGRMRQSIDFYCYIVRSTESVYLRLQAKVDLCVECRGKHEERYELRNMNPRNLDVPCYDSVDKELNFSDMIKTLSVIQQQVLRLRFCDNMTLRQASEVIGRSYERVRQIESIALDRLHRVGQAWL